jgi:hypothetical protein
VNDGVRVNVPSAPTEVRPGETAGDAYVRAAKAKPTGFADNPLGAMAQAMDKLGRAAGGAIHKAGEAAGQALQQLQSKFTAAGEAARANPNSLKAKQEYLTSGLALLEKLPAGDPNRVKLAGFLVQLGNQLGANGIPFNTPGMDMRGLLRLAANITMRFGDQAGMQAAFGLNALLQTSLGGSSVQAMQLRDQLLAKFQVTSQATQLLNAGWKFELAQAGRQPSVDMSSRTIQLAAEKEQASMAVLAKAFWHDNALNNPADKDGFINAFLKIANAGGFSRLTRKYKEVRALAQHQLATSGRLERVGHGESSVLGVVRKDQHEDEGADMFAALASLKGGSDADVPESLQGALAKFFVTA